VKIYDADAFREADDDELGEGPGEPDRKVMDPTTKVLLYDGASISQLNALFGHDNRTIAKKIQGLRPVGKRAGHPVYSVKDAAAYLVTPMGDIEDHIRKMTPDQLPPRLLKEFWAGQHARLKFEEDRGDLWRTSDVIEHLAEVFKVARSMIQLTVDHVERTTELSDKQRSIVLGQMDALMRNLTLNLIEKFRHEPDRDFDAVDEDGSGQADEGAQPERTEAAERDPAEGL